MFTPSRSVPDASSFNDTVTAGSWRGRYVSSILVSVFDSGVSQCQQYQSTRKPSYMRPLSHSVLRAHHDRLHVVGVEGLVVVVEVDPASLTGHVIAPLVGELEHRGTTGVVEGTHAVLQDLRVAGDAEFFLDLDLGRQAVAVPAEATLDLAAAHRLVARNGVFDVTGQQVAVVR